MKVDLGKVNLVKEENLAKQYIANLIFAYIIENGKVDRENNYNYHYLTLNQPIKIKNRLDPEVFVVENEEEEISMLAIDETEMSEELVVQFIPIGSMGEYFLTENLSVEELLRIAKILE